MSLRRLAALAVLAFLWPATDAIGQPIGTFRWQLQPYCNVLSLNVTQQAGIYTLDGRDDRCGATQAASAVGIAFLNADGTVGFGITIVLPAGTPIHIEATINLASLNGTWRDSAGNTGTFIFTPGSGIPGPARPVPSGGIAANSITAVQIAPAAVGTSELATNSVGSANIINGSVVTADLAAPPRAAFISGDHTTPLTTTATVIRTVSITAPSAGTVVGTASGFFTLNSGTVDYAACSLSTTTADDSTHITYAAEQGVANSMFIVPFAITRAVPVAAGVNSFYLICRLVTGNASVWRTSLNMIFIPS